MATTVWNNRVQDVGFEQKVPYKVKVDGNGDIKQGELLYYDSSSHTVLVVGSDGNAATFVGVAADTSYRNLYGTKTYPDSGTIQVYVAGIFTFKTTSGDTLTDGNSLYLGADAQTVTNTAGGSTSEMGIAKLRPGVSSLAGGSGINVDMLIVPRFPTATAL